MAIQPSIHWINNQTRLNAQNMNTIGNAIDEIGFELYGDNNNGLVNTVEVHNGWFIGDPQVNNSGVFTQLRQLGQALLTPTYNTTTNQVWASGTYNYNDILTHPTPIPDTENTADWNTGHSVAIDPVELRLFSNSGELQRSVLGAPSVADNVGESYIDALARTIRWNYTRVTDIGSIYRREGIYFNNDANTAPYIRADRESGRYSGLRMLTPSIRIAPNNDIDGNVYLTASESLTTLGSASSTVQIGKSNLLKVDNTSSEVYSTTFLPMYNTSTIGSASLPWESIRSINLHVNNLDVNTKAVIAKLEVTGTASFKDKVTIENNGLSVTGDTDVTGALETTGALTVGGITTLKDKVKIDKGGIEVHGATQLKNSLEVTNGATLNSTLRVKGTSTLEDILTVSGAITANDNLSVAKEASIKTLVANTADVKDSSGNYVQGTNPSSVVVIGTDADSNTFKGEIKARKAADEQLAKDYAAADETLQKTIVGNDTDTIEDNTLRGVINYANSEIASIRDLLDALEDTDVITAQPSVTLSTKNGTVDTVKAWEVGSDVTPKYSITFNAGTYQYGPSPTGCTAQTWYAKFGSVEKNTKTGTFDSVHVLDDTSIQLEVNCTYSDGGVPLSDLGREIPNSRIKAGTTAKKTATLTGFRQAFAGGMTSKTTELNSANIRLLSAKGSNTKSFDVSITKDAIRVVVAFPASWGALTKALDVNDSSKNIVTSFGTAQTEKVSGATAGQDEIDYKVYIMDFASAYGGSGNTYKITIG